MGLIEAIAAELDGDLEEAVQEYEQVAEIGSKLDKAGVWDAIARVQEKKGSLKAAAEWHARAARAFQGLPEDQMDPAEAQYQALTRFRAAFADWIEDPQYREGVMKEWGIAFEACWEAFPGGITHEALFYAKALATQDRHADAAAVLEDAARVMGADVEGPDDPEAEAVREVWKAAADSWEAAGEEDNATQALAKFEDLGGELPEAEEEA